MLGRWPKLARFWLKQAMSVGADWLSIPAPLATIKHLGERRVAISDSDSDRVERVRVKHQRLQSHRWRAS